MLRIGRQCIITFPNFGYWKIRLYLATNGRMPVTKELAYQWYDTPNIHFFTLTDFEEFCNKKSIKILSRQFFSNRFPDIFMKKMWPSMFAATAVFQLARWTILIISELWTESCAHYRCYYFFWLLRWSPPSYETIRPCSPRMCWKLLFNGIRHFRW